MIGTAAGPDGSLVVATADLIEPSAEIRLTRLTPRGSVDTSFGTGGSVTIPSAELQVVPGVDRHAIAVGQAGNVFVVGRTEVAGEGTDFAVFAMTPDGAPDPGFGAGGMRQFSVGSGPLDTDAANAVTVLPNGQLAVAGSSTRTDSSTQFAMVKLNADGSFDSTFGSAGKQLLAPPSSFELSLLKPVAHVYRLLPEDDGAVIVLGALRFATSDTKSCGAVGEVARVGPGGQLDLGFANGGFVSTSCPIGVDGVLTNPDSNLSLIATGGSYPGTNKYYAMTRLRRDGTTRRAFGDDGTKLTRFPERSATAAAILKAGQSTLVAGSMLTLGCGKGRGPHACSSAMTLSKFDSKGELKTSFGINGVAAAPRQTP